MIQRLSPQPPMIALRENQQYYSRGFYGSRTTSQYLSFSFWCPSLIMGLTGCPDVFHIESTTSHRGKGTRKTPKYK
jgi:hypothetical protein